MKIIFLLQAASVGLPLNKEHVKIIHSEFLRTIKHYKNFKNWKIWDKSVPDGYYGPSGGRLPDSTNLIKPEELGIVLEYCYSPYKNESSEKVVDADLIVDILGS